MISNFYNNDDYVVGNYRSHGISLALADNFEPLILELLAKSNGVSGGKAGSMHLSVPEKNLIWTSAIVGSGVPVAVGLAEALKRTTRDNIVSVMFGDGAIEIGESDALIYIFQAEWLKSRFFRKTLRKLISYDNNDSMHLKNRYPLSMNWNLKRYKYSVLCC